ncbi:MAG: hypothetical protein ACFNKE_00010 [Neisseria elongata]
MRVCGWYPPRTNGHFNAQILIFKGKLKRPSESGFQTACAGAAG